MIARLSVHILNVQITKPFYTWDCNAWCTSTSVKPLFISATLYHCTPRLLRHTTGAVELNSGGPFHHITLSSFSYNPKREMHWISKQCIKCLRILYCRLCPDEEQEHKIRIGNQTIKFFSKLEALSNGEVLDIKVEMNKLLEDIPIGFILQDEETPMLKTETETLLGAITDPPLRREAGQYRWLPHNCMQMLSGAHLTVGTIAGKSAWPS